MAANTDGDRTPVMFVYSRLESQNSEKVPSQLMFSGQQSASHQQRRNGITGLAKDLLALLGETKRIQVGKAQTVDSPAIAGTCRWIRVPELPEF